LRLKIEIFCKKKDTRHTNKVTEKFFVSFFGYKVNVRFNFCSWQTQAGTQVTSTILFRVSLFNQIIIEKALSQITNMEPIFSAKSLKRGQLPGCPPVVAYLVTLQSFQKCFS